MYCAQCGTQAQSSNKFCSKCGNKFTLNSQLKDDSDNQSKLKAWRRLGYIYNTVLIFILFLPISEIIQTSNKNSEFAALLGIIWLLLLPATLIALFTNYYFIYSEKNAALLFCTIFIGFLELAFAFVGELINESGNTGGRILGVLLVCSFLIAASSAIKRYK